MTGQRLLHYEIVERLGEGGMGVVYKARDTHLDRFVAIKVLPPERVADPSRKARFIQEAKAASSLNHPNIITIHDISSDAGHDFIAMEYVAGRTLDQLIPRKGMRLNEALKIDHSGKVIPLVLLLLQIWTLGGSTVRLSGVGIENVVAQKFAGQAVQLISAGFHRDADHATAGETLRCV